MPTSDDAPVSFKNWFSPDRYRQIAAALAKAAKKFDQKRFLELTLTGLEERELMDRLRQTAHAAHASLPGNLKSKLAVLRRTANEEEPGFVGIWFSEYVGLYGQDHPELSLPALAHFTRFGSAEFAIREFILRQPTATLSAMQAWTRDDNEHVRRLASEGSRPRLPWGTRLDFLVEDPTPTRPILEAMKADPSLYVRKSVANHLNDIAKDHPDTVVAWVSTWDRSDKRTAWIVKHGLRTLIKRGHAGALSLLGAGSKARLSQVHMACTHAKRRVGEATQLNAEFTSAARSDQFLIVDFVVHYVKANGRASPKVFKWKELTLSAGKPITLRKKLAFADLSTRRHYTGDHRIDLQVNGRVIATTRIELQAAR